MRRLWYIWLICSISPPALSQQDLYIPSGDNIIHVSVFGKGKPVLIVNGGPGMNSEGFQPLARRIGESCMAILYDQRGTGKSVMKKVDSTTITMDSMIYDMETIRKYLDIDHWVILGHSFGGMLASWYMARYPDRVSGAILSSSGGIDLELFSGPGITAGLPQEKKDSLAYWSGQIAGGDTSYYARLQRGRYLAPLYLYDQSHADIVARRLTQVNMKINQLVIRNMQKINFDCTGRLTSFGKPVLIIQGRQDIVPESIARKEHSILKNSEMVILENCGHFGWLDQPELYFNAINRFLESIF